MPLNSRLTPSHQNMAKRDSKIAHLTTVHPRHDVRIFIKETAAASEVASGAALLIVADGQGDEQQPGRPPIRDAGKPGGNRLVRFWRGPLLARRTIAALKPRIVHFHDPELIPLGIWLKLRGYRVVYDVHEDTPRQMAAKHWIAGPLRPVLANAVAALEWLGSLAFDGIVAATPHIAGRFPSAKTVVVQNYPVLSEFPIDVPSYRDRDLCFSYVGGLSRARGTLELLRAAELMADRCETACLELAGPVMEPSIETTLTEACAGRRVAYLGKLDRQGVRSALSRARAGLVTLHPTPAYVEAYPVKMFEYMAAGLPVIASDFPLWRSIVSRENCGILVNPLDPKAIADAMQWIIENPAEAEAMGQRGRQAILSTYNWDREAEKLKGLYRQLLAS